MVNEEQTISDDLNHGPMRQKKRSEALAVQQPGLLCKEPEREQGGQVNDETGQG